MTVKNWKRIRNIFFISYILPFILGIIQPSWAQDNPLMGLFAVMIILGSIISGFMAKGNERVRNGVPVVAELVSLRQTGAFLNEQPQCALTVQYMTQEGKQLTSVVNQFVQLSDLAKYQPGYRLMIEYDPQKPQNIKTGMYLDPAVQQKAKDQFEILHGQATQEFIDIRDKGIKASGVILTSKPTGNIVNGKGELELQVRVTRRNGSTYDVTTTKCVPQSGMAFTVPGSVVHVFYMPEDEQHIVIGFYA